MEKYYLCGQCNQQYDDRNIARLLVMCGHTFCQRCIKSMMNKKKDGKYKIICPIDGISKQLPNNTITNIFPKNVSLMDAISIKSQQTNQTEIDLTANQFLQSLPIHSLYKQSSNRSRRSPRSKQPRQIPQTRQSVDKKQVKKIATEQNICLLHQKPLDIVCIDDGARVCASCAIFGHHRGHKFKQVSEVQKQSLDKYEQMLTIIDIKNKTEKKLTNISLQKQIIMMLTEKKKKIKKQISFIIQNIFKTIKQVEKDVTAKIESMYNQRQELLKGLLGIKDEFKRKYNQWETMAIIQMKVLQSNNVEQKILLCCGNQKVLDKTVKQGEEIVRQILETFEQLNGKVKQVINSINVKFNPQLSNFIEQCIIVQDQSNNCFNTPQKKDPIDLQLEYPLSSDRIYQDESLLDPEDGEGTKFQVPRITISSPILSPQTTKKQSSLKKLSQSFRNLSVNQINPNLNKSDCKTSQKQVRDFTKTVRKKINKIIVPQIFNKVLEGINNKTLEIVDLTNAQLGDSTIHQISQTFSQKITTLKLGKNKISDQGFAKILPNLTHIKVLNLANNYLTQKSIQLILDKLDLLPKLKSLVISKNKIVEREHRQLIEKIKNSGINISI